MANSPVVPIRVRGIDSINLGHLAVVCLCMLILFSPSLLYIAIKSSNMLADCANKENVCTTPAGFHLFVSAVWATMFSLAATCGFIGTITSFFLRQTKNQPINTGRASGAIITYFGMREILVTGFFGVIFGLLMMALFIGGFVNGSLFPTVNASSWTAINVRMEAWAKIAVWCFIAGFSERLVPDFLDNLAHRAGSHVAYDDEGKDKGTVRQRSGEQVDRAAGQDEPEMDVKQDKKIEEDIAAATA